jgi:GGDEF domain-containing protein
MDRDFLRRFDTQAHLAPSNLEDSDNDVIGDDDRLSDFACEHQHEVRLSRTDPLQTPDKHHTGFGMRSGSFMNRCPAKKRRSLLGMTEELERRVDELTAELEALKVTLEVVGNLDLDSGILNRTGILDALERGQRWLARRGDIYGLLVVHFPALDPSVVDGPEAPEFRTHVAASMGAAVRDVDTVGRIDSSSFGAVLADVNPGAIQVVADRMRALLERLSATTPAIGGVFGMGGVEVLAAHQSGTVLDAALELARSGSESTPLAQLD